MTGAELKNGLIAIGATIDVPENINNTQETKIWNAYATQYATVMDFVVGCGVDPEQGGQIALNVMLSGDKVFVQDENGSYIGQNQHKTASEQDDGNLTVNGWTVKLEVQYVVNTGSKILAKVIYTDKDGNVKDIPYYEFQNPGLIPVYDTLDNWSIGVYCDGTIYFAAIFWETHMRWNPSLKSSGPSYAASVGLWANTAISRVDQINPGGTPGLRAKEAQILITIPSQGGGGPTFTLHFEATSGQSGGHTDLTGYTPETPLNTVWPIDQVEQTVYGSGGIGGFGGGGGAGGAETVIYDFSTERADNVEETAKAHRHGYGSGGGKGGKAGDGCIIVFY